MKIISVCILTVLLHLLYVPTTAQIVTTCADFAGGAPAICALATPDTGDECTCIADPDGTCPEGCIAVIATTPEPTEPIVVTGVTATGEPCICPSAIIVLCPTEISESASSVSSSGSVSLRRRMLESSSGGPCATGASESISSDGTSGRRRRARLLLQDDDGDDVGDDDATDPPVVTDPVVTDDDGGDDSAEITAAPVVTPVVTDPLVVTPVVTPVVTDPTVVAAVVTDSESSEEPPLVTDAPLVTDDCICPSADVVVISGSESVSASVSSDSAEVADPAAAYSISNEHSFSGANMMVGNDVKRNDMMYGVVIAVLAVILF